MTGGAIERHKVTRSNDGSCTEVDESSSEILCRTIGRPVENWGA